MVDGEVSLQDAVSCGSGQGCSQGAWAVTAGGRTDDTVRNGSGSPSSGDQQPSETLTASCWRDNNRQQIIKVSLVGKSKMQVTMETPHSYMFRCNK